MDEKKNLLEVVLGLRTCENRKSTLSLSLQNARDCSGFRQCVPYTRKEFDLRHQGLRTDDEADMFCALMNYLVVLEQIGTLFYKGRIIEALKESGMPLKQRCALNGLRNALAHHGGLAIWDEHKHKGYKFIVDFNDSADIVKLSSIVWNGDYSDKSEETSTTIYAISLIQLVENIVKHLSEKLTDFVDKCTLSQEEIATKFTILT